MTSKLKPVKISSCGQTDIGLVRQNNEDVWAEIPELGTYILADGMGGHRAGEVAASQAVLSFCKILKKYLENNDVSLSLDEMEEAIRHVIEIVNGLVFEMGSKDQELKGMGTTLCCMHFHQNGLVYGHVGDSRIYRYRSSELEQLTHDHSLLRELVDLGQINECQEKEFLYRNIITKAIGTEAFVDPSVYSCDVEVGDRFLMCSDGLSDLLSIDEIKDLMINEQVIESLVKKLVLAAKEKGGHDNITVVVIEVQEDNHGKDLSR